MKPVYDTINLIDERGIDLVVSYRLEKIPVCVEMCHGPQETEGGYEVSLESVELGIKGGKGIEILPFLNQKQRENIESEILNSI